MTNHNDQERALFNKWLSDKCVAHVNAGEYEAAATLRGACDVLYVGWQARAQLPAGGAVPYTLTEQAPFVIRDAQGRYVAELLAWDAELIGAMLAAAPHPVSGEQKAVEHVPLYESVQRVAAELPEGWEIRICVERDAGSVELFDADRCQVDGFPTNDERLDFTVIDALDAALAAHRAQAQGGDV